MGVVSDGKVIASAKIEANSSRGFLPLKPEIEDICTKWMRIHSASGIGIAFPSLVDCERKQILGHNDKFNDCEGFDFEKWIHERFGLPMVLENDANAAALGEMGYGAALGCKDFVLMILGTGIGTAAVMDGRLIRGKHYQAGNLFGHIPQQGNGRSCAGCPGFGCIEAHASTWALKEIANESPLASPLKNEPVLNFKILKEYYDAGDPLAASIFEECCDSWRNCLIALIYAYDPEVVVLSGGVLNWGNELPERLFREVKKRVWTPWGKLQYRTTQNPEYSVLLGLHYLNQIQSEKE